MDSRATALPNAPAQAFPGDEAAHVEDRGIGRFLVPLVIVALMGLGVAALWFTLGQGSSAPRRQVVKIAVLPDTPPPPPPKEEKKPEPEKVEAKPQPTPEQPKPVETPPAPQQLKMDGPAGDGPSAFAAGQVSQEYKGGEIGSGQGANRLQYAFFTNRLTRHIQSELARDDDLRGLDYRVQVRVWLAPGGAMEKVELLTSTGNPARDRDLRQALMQLPPVDQVPPSLPQPLTLRITNRVTG